MSDRYWTSDLHLGHRNIGAYRKIPKEFMDMANGNACEANVKWFLHYAHKILRPLDTLIVAGDSIFDAKYIPALAEVPGKKILIAGNHDDLKIEEYLKVFDEVHGMRKVRGIGWVSHAPIHPAELRDKLNIHGHVHYQTVPDWRYINICCDNLFEETGSPIISDRDLRKIIKKRIDKQKVVY